MPAIQILKSIFPVELSYEDFCHYMKVTKGVLQPNTISLMSEYSDKKRKISLEEDSGKEFNNQVFEARVNDNYTIYEFYTNWKP